MFERVSDKLRVLPCWLNLSWSTGTNIAHSGIIPSALKQPSSIMMTNNSASAPVEADESIINTYEIFCAAYRQREDTLTLIYQLNQMIKAVQKHRGMSMGLLAGNAAFIGDFEILQRQLERRLATLETFAHETGGLLSQRDKKNLHLAWETIRHNWQDDDVSDNFELHSHFVEQLHGMIFSLAKQLEAPLSGEVPGEVSSNLAGEVSGNLVEPPALLQSDRDGVSYPRMFKQIELLNFVTTQLPEMIEQIAKIRGLSTYAAATGEVRYHNDRKLRFLLQCSRRQSEKLRHQAERLEGILNGGIKGLIELKNLELKLIYFLNSVERDVLSGRTITASSHQLFKLATELIDVYWAVVNEGLDMVRKWHADDLENWLKL